MTYMNFTAPVAELEINLTRSSDFVRALVTEEGETFPAGTQVVLDFGGTDQWPATVTSTEASWNVDKAVVNTLIATGPSECSLRYIDGSIDLLWAHTAYVAIDG